MRNYTLELRPTTSVASVTSMVYTQESKSWFKACTNNITPVASSTSRRGVSVRTPLQSVSISVTELAELLQGVEVAYDQLAEYFYQELPEILKNTPFGSLDVFQDCLPPETPSLLAYDKAWDSTSRVDSACCIYLADDAGHSLVWDGSEWCITPRLLESPVWVGMVFGINVYYTPADGDTNISLTGEALVSMVTAILDYKVRVLDVAKKYLAVFGYMEDV